MLIAGGEEEQHASIPPFNINAKTAADVYKLDDSILWNVFVIHHFIDIEHVLLVQSFDVSQISYLSNLQEKAA